jgi:hypothetical protein
MPLVVMEAEVAATENNVLGSLPSLLPATALIPSWNPMVGLAAIFGTTVMGDRFLVVSAFLLGCRILWKRSDTSYCRPRFSAAPCSLPASKRSESAFNESAGTPAWPLAAPAIRRNNRNGTNFKTGYLPHRFQKGGQFRLSGPAIAGRSFFNPATAAHS